MSLQGARLKRIWTSLPRRWMSETEADEAIIAAAGAYEGDFALAAAYRTILVSCGALVWEPMEPLPRVRKAKSFPDVEEVEFGSDAYNAQLAAEAAEENRRFEAEHRSKFESSPENLQQQQLIALIDQRVEQRLGEALDGMVDESVRELLSKMDRSTLNWPRNRLSKSSKEGDLNV